LGEAAEIFGSGTNGEPQSQGKIRELHEKIGELTVEKDFSYGPFPVSRQIDADRVLHDSDRLTNE
jgi:hypothetical protein